jgi:hypothetical protein
MKKNTIILVVALLSYAAAGCSGKTPEQIEADKYPKVKVNTPEEDKAMRERLHLGGPLTGPTQQQQPTN